MNTEQKQFQEKLKEIYKRQDEIEPLVEGLEDEIPQKSMKDYYIKLQTIVDENKEKKQAGYEKSSNNRQEVEVENIFDKLPGQETIKNSGINKLLILGGAGVGKSTLMRYMAYKWGEGELWKDKFDFIYRVPLKILLNHEWKLGRYNPDDLNDHELKCLVHYNLMSTLSRKEREECKLEKIVWLDGKNKDLSDRILLLLDGYDEVAHLRKDDFKNIFEEVFEFKNIILTSRPNAMTREMAEKFDRTIENSGLGNEGINQYFSRYFQQNEEKGKELQDFLAKNPSIREICNIPVNIAMLCFIWAEEESKIALQKISSMSDLYGQVVDHLGFRYYTKQQPESAQNQRELRSLWQGGKIQLDELQVLQHVAYRGLIGDGLEAPDGRRPETLIIKGMIARDDKDGTSVQSSINRLRDKCANKNLTINSVYKYGLLKTEGLSLSEGESPVPLQKGIRSRKDLSDINLQAQNFSFIHLSFQEYLTAQHLVEQLIYGSEDQKTIIADFIAYHRNEPRYGLILKFMAGIFRATPGKDENLIKAIKIFWDSIVCNPNGALEFGIDAKVNILMHLLSQAKDEQGKIDERIPNQELMVKFIDYQMLGSIMWMINELKESDYISANIKEDIFQIALNENYQWGQTERMKIEKEFDLKFQINSQDAENEIEIEEELEFVPMTAASGLPKSYAEEIGDAFNSLINHFSAEEQENIVKKLLQDVKNYNKDDTEKVQVCKRKIGALTKIFQSGKLNPQDSRAFIEILFATIYDNTLGDVSVKGIVETLKASNDPSLKDLVKEGLRKSQIDPEAKNLKAHLESVAQLLRITESGKDFLVMKKVSNFVVSMLNHSNILVRETASRLIILTLDECGGNEKIEFIQDLLKSLTPILGNPESSIHMAASKIICRLISSPTAKANSQVLKEFAKDLIPFLKDFIPSVKDFLSFVQNSGSADGVSMILEVLVMQFVSSDPDMMQEIIRVLILQLRTSNLEKIQLASKRLLKIAEIYGNQNSQLIQDVVTELISTLQSSEEKIRQSSLSELINFALIGKNPQIYAQIIEAFTPLLCDSNEILQTMAVQYTAELFKASPNADKKLFMGAVNCLVKGLGDSDSSKRNIASKALPILVNKCDIDDVQWIREIIDSIMPLAKESSDVNKREVAIDTILELVEKKETQGPPSNPFGTAAVKKSVRSPQLIREVIDTFTSRLSKASPQFRSRILVTIAELEKIGGNNNTEKLKGIINELNPLLKDRSNDVKQTSAKGILELLKIIEGADSQLLRNTIENFISMLGDPTTDGNLRVILIFYITEISKINEDKDVTLLNEIIPILVPYLQDASLDSKPMQQDAIVAVARLIENSTTPPNIQLMRIMISALVRIAKVYHLPDEHILMRIPGSIERVAKTHKNSDSQTRGELIEILIPLLGDDNVKRADFMIKNCIRELAKNKDSQLFGRVQNVLNQHFKKFSEVNSQVRVLELRAGLEVMNDEVNIQRVQDLIAILKPYLKSEEIEVKQRISWCLAELIGKSPDLRDAGLVQDIVDVQNFLLKNAEESQKAGIPFVLMNLVSLMGAKDQAFIKNIIMIFVLRLRYDCSYPQASSLDFLNELFKLYGNVEIELIKEMVEKVTPHFDEVDAKFQGPLHAFVQRLSVFLLPHPYVLEEYLDHANKNLRQNFRAGVFNYFKTYLNRFEAMESLMSKGNIKDLTLEGINGKLFDGLLVEAGSTKISSSLNLLRTSNNDLEQQIVNLKLLIAHEIDLVEIRKGIRLAQVAYISIYRSEYSEYEIEKELPDLSWQVLSILVKYFTKEKLQWISDNYYELAASAPTVNKIACIRLYHRMLADRVITPLEERIITVFLQQGLTTSLTNQGEIIFQGVTYQIEGDDIRFMLERIARVIIKYGQDLLARQYKMNIPLFEKSFKEGGMQEAAVDRRKVPSLVDKRFILRSDFWLLTSLKPLSTTSELILLEQRSAFGNHVVFKLEGGENFKELPENVNLEEVFGKYQPGLIYSGISKRLSPQTGQELVKNIWTKFADVEGPQVGQTGLYYQQELLGGGKEDRILRALASKQDNPLRALENQLETLSLQQQDKVALQEYYEGFIATFGSVYAVSHIIDSGMFAVEIEKDGQFSPVGLFTTLVALIPFGIGEKLSEGIENLAFAVKQNKVKNEAIFMKALAIDAVDLSDRVSKVALERILKEENRREILEAKDPDPEGVIEKVQELVTSKIEQLKSKAIQISKIDNLFAKEIQKSPAFRLGESQANEMIQEWFKFNHAEGSLELSPEDRRTKFIQLVITQNNLRLQAKKNNVVLDGTSEGKPGCCMGCEIF